MDGCCVVPENLVMKVGDKCDMKTCKNVTCEAHHFPHRSQCSVGNVRWQGSTAPTISGLFDNVVTLLVTIDLRNWLATRNREANILL